MRIILFTIFAGIITSCSGVNTYIDSDKRDWREVSPPNEELLYQMFLIGDAGSPSLDNKEPNLRLFQKFINEADKRSAAIFLGDNIYLNGLPDSTHPKREFYQARIDEQLKTVEDFKGRVIFIPGNHDWDNGEKGGLETVQRQEAYIEKYLDRGNTFLPDNGFPGPVEVKLFDKDDDPRLRQDIIFIALDTQWWLHEYEKPYGDTGDYDLIDAGDIVTELQNIIRDNKNDFIVIGAHHPLVSNGNHGGHFPPGTHLKPPIFGSLYILYRKIFGLRQDLTHHDYKKMSGAIKESFSEKEEIVYVSGHGHTLQYHRKIRSKRYPEHYIISGAGTKDEYAAKGRGAEFVHSGTNGFVILKYYADGSVWMEAWKPEGDGSTGDLIYRTRIQEAYGDPLSETSNETITDIDYTDSTMVVAPNNKYDHKGALYNMLLGSNKREIWGTEVEFPFFDVSEIEGGLTPVRSGGKGQSNTLHLEGENGKEYVLRSVDKEAGKIWDEGLKKSFALDVAQDQFSMLDPYAAVIVASLANASGIYHVDSKIYIIPDDPKLGEFGDLMAGRLGLFERKPDNDMSDVDGVGNADDVISHLDMISEIDGDIDHRVDQELFARSRLFDMLISDWDRHYDQWRWAAVEPEDKQGKIYKPIPRDRDVAFMRLNGIGPSLAKLGPFFQYQNFSVNYTSLEGINFNSLDLTRRFTNKLTKEDWIRLAEEITAGLTDEVITESAHKYPDEVYKINGERMETILKARRDKLIKVAEEYYSMISDVVSIPASHKRELIRIDIESSNEVRIRINKLSGKGELRGLYFDRSFRSNETSEIRLYGMGGDDRFEVTGQDKNKIRIRIIGGPGDDVFIDGDSDTKRKVVIYDTESGIDYLTGRGTKVKLVQDPMENRYNYINEYNWNSTALGFYFSFNDDDGLFIGGGPKFTRHGFRKNPAEDHFLRANYAPLTGAANFKYEGNWYKVAGEWDGKLKSDFEFPKSYRFFFGLGNETDRETQRSADYYRAQLSQYDVLGEFSINLNNYIDFSFGGGLEYTELDDIEGEASVLNNPQLGVNPNIFEDQWYSSLSSALKIQDIGNLTNPLYGVTYSFNTDFHFGLNEASESHINLSSNLKMYYSLPTKRQVTFTNRIGGTHIIGDFPFFKANTIGGHTNLRGYNSRRFSGRSSVYNNTEVRFELFNFYRYLLGGRGGALTFFDLGRVWTDGENSSIWHNSAGGGIWFNLFDSFLFSLNLGKSEEDYSLVIKSGFFF